MILTASVRRRAIKLLLCRKVSPLVLLIVDTGIVGAEFSKKSKLPHHHQTHVSAIPHLPWKRVLTIPKKDILAIPKNSGLTIT